MVLQDMSSFHVKGGEVDVIGYEVCPIGSRALEPGVQKIALYVDEDGTPTHAARQLPSGEWTSKLGRAEDIRHKTLEALEGSAGQPPGYGRAKLILKRVSPQV